MVDPCVHVCFSQPLSVLAHRVVYYFFLLTCSYFFGLSICSLCLILLCLCLSVCLSLVSLFLCFSIPTSLYQSISPPPLSLYPFHLSSLLLVVYWTGDDICFQRKASVHIMNVCLIPECVCAVYLELYSTFNTLLCMFL